MGIKQTWLSHVLIYRIMLTVLGGKKDLNNGFFSFLEDYHDEIKYLSVGLTEKAPDGTRLYWFSYRAKHQSRFYGIKKMIEKHVNSGFWIDSIKDYTGFDICLLIE